MSSNTEPVHGRIWCLYLADFLLELCFEGGKPQGLACLDERRKFLINCWIPGIIRLSLVNPEYPVPPFNCEGHFLSSKCSPSAWGVSLPLLASCLLPTSLFTTCFTNCPKRHFYYYFVTFPLCSTRVVPVPDFFFVCIAWVGIYSENVAVLQEKKNEWLKMPKTKKK